MTDAERARLEHRLLVLAPTARDADLTESVLGRAHLTCDRCADVAELCEELDAGAGAVLLAEEACDHEGMARLAAWLGRQPAWSEVPILVLARSGADSAAIADAMERLGHVSVLERPMRVPALLSAARTALRDRRRQYEARAHLAHIERSERELRDFFDNATIGLHWVGPDGTILRVNQTELDMLGYTRDEYVGRHIAEFHTDTSAIGDILRRLAAGETLRDVETQLRCKDGSPIDVLIDANVLWEGGRFVHARCFVRDVTDRKRAEEALLDHEVRLASEAGALTQLNELSSRLWRMDSLREGLDEMLAATIELLGADMGHVQILQPEQGTLHIVAQRGFRPDVLELFRDVPAQRDATSGRALRSGHRIVIDDVQADASCAPAFRAAAQKAGYRAVQSTPLLGHDGLLLGVLSTHFRLVHRPSEQDLRRLDLYVRQAADFIERCRADEALREGDRRKDEFLAVLAHELRNPLAPISNSLHLLRLAREPDPSTDRVVDMLQRQVNHLVRLVDDLMEVSRISRGKIELRMEPLDLSQVVRSAVETSGPLIEAHGHQLTVTMPDGSLTLHGDAIRLSQVVANLLNNAAKYTPPGGRIDLEVRPDGDGVQISVRDTGAGIPPEQLPRIFDMFMQIDRNAGRVPGGLGIGLALVKSLVEMHGGTVGAHSDGPGQGSEFVVRLPLVGSQRGDAPADKPAQSSATCACRVLVVDDNRDAAQSLGMMLKLMGADVHVAFNGPDALDALASYKPAAVLLDIGMPGMNGYEVARRIREQPEFRNVTLIALTGWGQEEDRVQSRSAGFDYHLVKPADVSALQTLLLSLDPGAHSRQAS